MSFCAVMVAYFLDVFKRTVSWMGSGVGYVGNSTLCAAPKRGGPVRFSGLGLRRQLG